MLEENLYDTACGKLVFAFIGIVLCWHDVFHAWWTWQVGW